MALGFVIDRFGIVVRNVLPTIGPQVYPQTFSFWAGTSLVILGAALALTAAVRYAVFAVRYRRGSDTAPGPGLLLGIVFTVAIVAVGVVIVVYLVTFTDTSMS